MRQIIVGQKRSDGRVYPRAIFVLISASIFAVLVIVERAKAVLLPDLESVDSSYDATVAALLARRLDVPGASYLLLDARTRQVIAARWHDRGQAIPVGSLVKPFTALAYAAGHGFRYPHFVCHGSPDGCWLPRGHGHLNLELAIAYSCNAYFKDMASQVKPSDTLAVMRHFRLGPDASSLEGQALAGLGSTWRARPEDLARAYCELASERSDPGVGEIVSGMALSARFGTASAIRTTAANSVPRREPRHSIREGASWLLPRPAALPLAAAPVILAKTGTAPCAHPRRGQGDGYVMALWPAESPRFALLVQAHEKTGAETAAVAGEIIRMLAEGQ